MGDLLQDYLQAAPLLALGAIFIILNFVALATRRSTVPLLGAAFGAGGCLMHPDLRNWAWIPVLIDPGTLALLRDLPGLIRRERRYLKQERLAEFLHEEGGRRVRLELFASGACRLHFAFKPPARTSGLAEAGLLGRWKVGGGKRARRLFLVIDEGDPGRYEFSAEGDPVCLTCLAEKHPIVDREPAAALTGSSLKLVSGRLPKLNPAAPRRQAAPI